MAALRGAGPFAFDTCSYNSAASDFSANLDPLSDVDQRNILAKPFISVNKMEANNNYEKEDLKNPTDIGDTQNPEDPQQGDEDDSGDEEVWESVSELASDEEYVTDDGDEEEGEEVEFEEEEDDDDDDDDGEDDDDSMAEEEEEEEEEDVEGDMGIDDATMSSGDEGGEKCAICLCAFRDQEVGMPESCDHTFCFECIYEWSKNVTTCPVDRSVFTLILVRNTIHGEIVRQMEVKAQEVIDEDQDPTYCEVCGECDREDRLLLCDECDAGYHCECLTPPLVDIPIEEWYCPNCATANHDDVSSEEEYMADLRRPLRRVREYARAIARTQVAERVLSRVRQARELRRIDEEEQAGTSTATRAPRVPKPRRKTTRKRKSTKRKTTKRKTTKRKTTKRKTTKRKTTKRKKSSKTTSSTTASGTKKKRRKTTRRRRKRKVRRTSVGARTAQPSVAKTIRRRIAGKLNLVSPKVGSMMPDMKQKGEHSLLFKRHDIGVASLTLTGGDHIFDPSGYDESPIIRRPGAQSAPTPAKPLPSAAPGPSSGGGALDLLGSILQGQNILHMKSENITIHKDGTLSSARKKDSTPSPKKSPTKTAHRPSTSSTTSHHHNSEKLKSNVMKHANRNDLQGQRSSQHQGQRRSESSRQDSSSKRMSQEIDYDDGIDDLELIEMDIDDDDEDVGGGGGDAFMEDLRYTSKRESSREASQHAKHRRQGSNTNSEITRTKGNVDLDSVRGHFAPHSTEEKHQGSEYEDQDENENDESDGDVGYHGNSDNQGGEEDGGYHQEGEGGDEDDGNHDENTVNNNNNNNGDGGDGGEEGEGGGEDGGEGDGEGEEHDEDNEEEAEEEEEEEEEVEGEIEEEHAPESNKKEEAYAEAEDEAEIYEEAEVEKEESLDENNDREYDPADDVAEENEGDKEYDPAMPIEGYLDGEDDSLQEGEDSNQTDICEDGGEKEEDQADEEEVEDEQEIEDEVEEDVQEEEEQEEDEQDEAQEEQEIQQSGPEVVNTVNDQNREEQNFIEEGLGRGDGANEELKEDEEEEDGEAEEGEELDEEHNSQEMANVNDKSQEETDEMKLKSGIGKLECEDISDEDNVPEGDGDEDESDEEGMIIETSDGRFIEAKPKSKTSRTPRRSEQSDTRETSAEVTESDVKHGPSSAEEGEVKTDDESKKGKKTRGKRKRKPKKRTRDKRNVVVDPRKSISLHPQMPPDLTRLPKRGEEPSSRREGSRESYGDLRQVIQVKRDTPYTAEELRRYHEEYWEEYNRRRDERRVERVGSSWDQYTYDQYAYYEAWRSMGGEFATGRPWGLHVQRDRSPIYDRRKNGAEPQVFDPRLEALRQSQRKESERGKEEGPGKSGEKKPKSDSDSSRKDHTTKKDGSRSQKDEKDKLKKEKTKEKSKGLVHENSARDKNGRERGGGERDKRIREKEKVKEKENHDKHGHDREKDRSRHKEREKSRERERSRKDSDHRSRDKERHRSPVRERSRDRGRERSRDRYHKKSRDTERSRSKDNDHSRSRHRSRSRDRSRDRSRKRDRSSESDRVSSRDRRKDKPRDKVQDRGREKDIRTSRNQDKGKERERSRDTVRTKKTEEMKSTSSSKVPLRKERGKVTVDASGVRKILLGEKSKPKEPKKIVEKPATAVVKVEKMKVKKIKKDKAGGENKIEKKGKKTKVKGEKKLTKGKKKKAAAKRPLSFDVDEIAAPPVKKKATSAAVVQAKKIEDVVLKPPSPLKVDDAEDMVPVPSTTRSVSHSPDLYIDIAVPDNDLSRIAPESPKVVFKAKSPTDVAVADSSHLENDMYDPFEPTASPPSGIKSPSPIPSEASPRHDTATSSSLEVFATKRATTPPPEIPPNPTSTTDVSSSDMATNPSQTGMTNEDRLMLASQASQQITKILNQLATVPVTKPPRVSPESPDELAMSSASIELGLSPEHIRGSSLSVSSLGSDHKNFKVEPIMPEDNAGDGPEDDIEMSAVDLYNKNSRDRYLKKLYHQERVVEEVKLAIKPHYQRKVINKEDYKEILRKSVTQVCHSKTGEINPVKIRRLIDGYVKKAQHKNKKPSGGDGHKSSKQGGGSAGKSGFKSSSRGPSKGSSKASKEPASASKLIEKGRSLGLKSK